MSPSTGSYNIAMVIGDPISHSLSPILHNGWIEDLGLTGEYIAKQIAAEDLAEAFDAFRHSEELRGFNITLPHKEAALELVDEVEETAEIIGAVNTVIIADGKLLGFNTDAYGFWQNLKAHEENIANYLNHPVVNGAGGAARAVLYALEKAGAKNITVVARDVQKAESLKEVTKSITIIPFSDFQAVISNVSLLINTTPLGMKGKEAYEWNLDGLARDAVVTDIVYNPIQTSLLKAATARGNKTIDGLGMLIFQALPGFEAWFGGRPELNKEALKTLKKRLAE